MAGQYAGIAKIALAKSGGRPVLIALTVAGRRKCAVAEMSTNNRLAPGQPVPQLRFDCAGYCLSVGLPVDVPKRSSPSCRLVDRLAGANANTPLPQGVAIAAPPAGWVAPHEAAPQAPYPAIGGGTVAGGGAAGGFFGGALPPPTAMLP